MPKFDCMSWFLLIRVVGVLINFVVFLGILVRVLAALSLESPMVKNWNNKGVVGYVDSPLKGRHSSSQRETPPFQECISVHLRHSPSRKRDWTQSTYTWLSKKLIFLPLKTSQVGVYLEKDCMDLGNDMWVFMNIVLVKIWHWFIYTEIILILKISSHLCPLVWWLDFCYQYHSICWESTIPRCSCQRSTLL